MGVGVQQRARSLFQNAASLAGFDITRRCGGQSHSLIPVLALGLMVVEGGCNFKHICANLIVAVTMQNFSLGRVESWCKSNVARGQNWSVPPLVSISRRHRIRGYKPGHQEYVLQKILMIPQIWIARVRCSVK